ncbi:MAG: hypothetical protein KAS87_02100 [Candidatus Omnitrophica bacterium]|nr:hypothetical protein [Candidatus Omnitrophota bacterium]
MGLLESDYYYNTFKKTPTKAGQVISDYPTTPIKELGEQQQQLKNEEVKHWLQRPGAGKIEGSVRRTMSDYATVFKGTSEAMGEELKKQFEEEDARGATGFDYFKMGAKAPGKIAWAFGTTLLKETLKAPLRISHSMLEAENRFISKKLGVKQTIGKSYNLPILGEIQSFGGSYDEDIKNGMSPLTASMNTAIRFGTDVSIAFLPLDAYHAVFSSRAKVVRKGKVTRDGKSIFEELPPEQKLRMTNRYREVEAQFRPEKFTKQKGPDMTTGDMFISKQNPNVAYTPIAEEGIKHLGVKGGTTKNILWRKTNIGNGLVQHDIVMLMGSRYAGIKGWTKAQLEKRFGKSKVIEGEFGPEVKIKSITNRIGENGALGVAPKGKVPAATVITKAKPADIPGWEKMTDVQKAEAIGAEPAVEGVSKEITPLITEARKYKSAEEFVEAQPKVYHGSPSKFKAEELKLGKGQYGEGFYFAKKEGKAELFAKKEGKEFGQIIEVNLKLEKPFNIDLPKLVKGTVPLSVEDFNAIKKASGVNLQETTRYRPDILYSDLKKAGKNPNEILKKVGFDGIIGGDQIVSFTKKNFKTKSQLTDIYNKATTKADIAAAEKLAVPPEVTNVMSKPLKGSGDKMVKGRQIDEMKYLQEQKGFSEEDLFLVSKMLNGKTNFNELTQNEAFAVSEALRGIADPIKKEIGLEFDLPDIGGIGTFIGLNKSWTHQARRWMSDYEREAMMKGHNYPVYSEVYMPIELGSRLRDGAFIRFRDSLYKDVYGKYAKPKFEEERRLIDAYLRGDRKIISANETLSAEVKADLIKIAESQRAWYEKARKDPAGTMSEKYAGIYSPELREKGAAKMYKTDELQQELTAFYKFERAEETLTPYITDPIVLMEIYAHGFYTQKYLKPHYDHATKVINKLPVKAKAAATDYIQEKLGYKDATEKALNRFGEILSKNSGGKIPSDALMMSVDVLSKNAFFGALLSPMAPTRNFFQFAFISIPDLGFYYALEGWKAGFDPVKVGEMRRRGILTGTGTEYGGEAVKAPIKGLTGLAGRGIEKYTDAQEWALKATYGVIDTCSRTGAATGVEKRFYDHWNALAKGKITQAEFEAGIDMASYDPITQQMLRKRFAKGDQASIKEANEIQLMLTVDREHFPYRKGTQTRAHYGLRGREGLKFTQWIWEYSFTISDWIKRGQWDKIVRFVGMGALIKNTFEEAYEIDISKWVTGGPFGGMPMGPIASLAVESASLIKNLSYRNHEAIDNNWRNIANVIKLHGGVAVGPVQKARLDKFNETIQKHEAGIAVSPDPEKPFSTISATGKHVRWASFTELLLDTFGFVLIEETEQSERLNKMYLETKGRNKEIDEAMRYYVRTGDIGKALEPLIDANIPMPNIRTKLESYGIDLDDRLYERLPIDLKIKLFPLFYPSEE